MMICHIASRMKRELWRIPTYFLTLLIWMCATVQCKRNTHVLLSYKKDKENQKHWNPYSRFINDYHGHITSFIPWTGIKEVECQGVLVSNFFLLYKISNQFVFQMLYIFIPKIWFFTVYQYCTVPITVYSFAMASEWLTRNVWESLVQNMSWNKSEMTQASFSALLTCFIISERV